MQIRFTQFFKTHWLEQLRNPVHVDTSQGYIRVLWWIMWYNTK